MGGGKGGGSSSKIEVTNSGTTNVNSNSVIDIVGLDDIDVRSELVLPQPFRSENDSRTELAITEPIVTESTNQMALDIRPLVIDSCTRLEFGPVPSMHVHQPYHRHFGVTLFGIEIMGFNMVGEEQFIVKSLPDKPHVVRGGVSAAREETGHRKKARGRRDKPRGRSRSSGRLRIRLEP